MSSSGILSPITVSITRFLFVAEVSQTLATPVLLTLRALSDEEETQPAVRRLNVGCVRITSISQKKVH